MAKFRPKIKPENINNVDPIEQALKDKMEILFSSIPLLGKCNLYSLYTDVETGQHYGLVHADYMEKHGFKFENDEFLVSVRKDAETLHAALLKSGLNVAYYFIMPYFINIKEECFLHEIILTNKMKTE